MCVCVCVCRLEKLSFQEREREFARLRVGGTKTLQISAFCAFELLSKLGNIIYLVIAHAKTFMLNFRKVEVSAICFT